VTIQISLQPDSQLADYHHHLFVSSHTTIQSPLGVFFCMWMLAYLLVASHMLVYDTPNRSNRSNARIGSVGYNNVMQNPSHLQKLFRYDKRNKWIYHRLDAFQSKEACMVFSWRASRLLCNANCGGESQCQSRHDTCIYDIVRMNLGTPEPFVLSSFASWNRDDDTCINSLRNSLWVIVWLFRACFYQPIF